MNDPNWDTYTWWSINRFSWWVLRTFAHDFLKFQVGRMERDVKGGHLCLELCSDLKLATGWSYYIMHQLHWAHPTFLAQFRSDMEKEREQKVHKMKEIMKACIVCYRVTQSRLIRMSRGQNPQNDRCLHTLCPCLRSENGVRGGNRPGLLFGQ